MVLASRTALVTNGPQLDVSDAKKVYEEESELGFAQGVLGDIDRARIQPLLRRTAPVDISRWVDYCVSLNPGPTRDVVEEMLQRLQFLTHRVALFEEEFPLTLMNWQKSTEESFRIETILRRTFAKSYDEKTLVERKATQLKQTYEKLEGLRKLQYDTVRQRLRDLVESKLPRLETSSSEAASKGEDVFWQNNLLTLDDPEFRRFLKAKEQVAETLHNVSRPLKRAISKMIKEQRFFPIGGSYEAQESNANRFPTDAAVSPSITLNHTNAPLSAFPVFNQSASDNSHFFSSDQGSDTPITLKKHPPATVHALDASLTPLEAKRSFASQVNAPRMSKPAYVADSTFPFDSAFLTCSSSLAYQRSVAPLERPPELSYPTNMSLTRPITFQQLPVNVESGAIFRRRH